MQQNNPQQQPARRRINAFTVSGISVRTTNREESDPATARLGTLWGHFFGQGVAERVPHRPAAAAMYGVYSAYESDHSGAFDVTAGVNVLRPTQEAGFASVRIEAGEYLVFPARGAMPQAVIETWGRIWRFFEEHPEIARSYSSDFEAYSGADEVAIHIGVQGG